MPFKVSKRHILSDNLIFYWVMMIFFFKLSQLVRDPGLLGTGTSVRGREEETGACPV